MKNKHYNTNDKAIFAMEILDEYRIQKGVLERSTSDLSPLEEWLILKIMDIKLKEIKICVDESIKTDNIKK